MTEWLGATGRVLRAFARCRSAAVAPLMALMLLPIAGGIAFAVELGGWNYTQRAMQNAADAAALAAASVNSTHIVSGTVTDSANEAIAAAKRFGFTDGSSNTSVSATTVTCPTGVVTGSTCWVATVSTVYPVLFSGALGFGGTQALGSGRGEALAASAVATVSGGGSSTRPVCLWSLSTIDTLTANGSPGAALTGCALVSNGDMNCNGHSLQADYAIQGVTETKDSGCALLAPQNDLGPNDSAWPGLPTDPYNSSSYYGNIPTDNCAGVYLPVGKKGNPNFLSTPFTGQQKFCGDVQLTTNITLTGSDTTLVVYNGKLDLNGNSITTASGASATIILAGTSTLDASKGTIDIQAPPSTSSSAWKGVAIYQDPRSTAATQGSSFSGSQSTIKVTGLVYLPKTDLTINGTVNKSTGGADCLLIIANSLTFNGINLVAKTTGCPSAGLGSTPSVAIGGGTVIRLVL